MPAVTRCSRRCGFSAAPTCRCTTRQDAVTSRAKGEASAAPETRSVAVPNEPSRDHSMLVVSRRPDESILNKLAEGVDGDLRLKVLFANGPIEITLLGG